jgi:GT2 family glycosyltransferase
MDLYTPQRHKKNIVSEGEVISYLMVIHPDHSGTPAISFCIVSYNTWAVLRDCLDSLMKSSISHPYEIIVVDNKSTDQTVEMLNTVYPNVKVICNSENRGYTIPMNQAFAATRHSQYIVQLNPDTIVETGCFDNLYEFMEAHPSVGICTPKVLNRDGSFQRQCKRSAARPWDAFCYTIGLARLFRGSKLFDGYLLGHLDENLPAAVEAVSGSCMFIRRQVIDAIGGLDEAYFAFQEDTDFCFRAREAGWQIYFVPDAQIIHLGGQGGSQKDLEKSIIEWHRSYLRYYRSHIAAGEFFFVNWLMIGGIYLKLGLALLGAKVRLRRYVGTPKP